MLQGPVTISSDGVRVALNVTPRASRNLISGLIPDSDGNLALKVQVTAAPESGRANAAVLKLLARAWQLPKSTMTIVSGATGRRKVVAVSGDTNAINSRINDWMETAFDDL